MLTLFFDGLYEAPPDHPQGSASRSGFLSYGWLICDEPDGRNEGAALEALLQQEQAPEGGSGCLLLGRGYWVVGLGQGATSVAAEYLALIEGLEAAIDLLSARRPALDVFEAPLGLRIVGDARGVIDQMTGQAAVNSAQVRPLHARAVRLARRLQALRSPGLRLLWTWLPRRWNRRADRLTRIAMRRLHSNRSAYQAALQTLAESAARPSRKSLNLVDLRVYAPPG